MVPKGWSTNNKTGIPSHMFLIKKTSNFYPKFQATNFSLIDINITSQSLRIYNKIKQKELKLYPIKSYKRSRNENICKQHIHTQNNKFMFTEPLT